MVDLRVSVWVDVGLSRGSPNFVMPSLYTATQRGGLEAGGGRGGGHQGEGGGGGWGSGPRA